MLIARRPRTNQSSVGPILDRGHPLARNLGFAIVGGDQTTPGRVRDMVRGRTLTSTGGANVGRRGRITGPRCETTDAGFQLASMPPDLRPASIVSLMWRGMITNNVGTYLAIGGVVPNRTDDAPYAGFQFMTRGTTTSVSVMWNNGTEREMVLETFSVNTVRSYMFTMDATAARAYVNGVEVANSANVGTITYSADATVFLGNPFPDAPRTYASITEMLYIWPNRALMASEVLRMHRDPYAFVRFPGRSYVDVKAAAAPSGRIWRLAGVGGGLVGRPGRLAAHA